MLTHTRSKLSGGVVHKLPADFAASLSAKSDITAIWEDITPLARNEWICWVEEAKKPETRARRITIANDKMSKGMRRPCCWMGCNHRERNGKA